MNTDFSAIRIQKIASALRRECGSAPEQSFYHLINKKGAAEANRDALSLCRRK